MDTMPDDISVFEPHAGSDDHEVRVQWRTNRRAAYWMHYKDWAGKAHPAVRLKGNKAILTALLDEVEPPRGMTWLDFGETWDLHPEHPFTPVLRKRPVSDDWDETLEASAETLPTE